MEKVINLKQLSKCDLSCLKCGSEVVVIMGHKKTWAKCYNCGYEYLIKERLEFNQNYLGGKHE